MRDLDHSQVKEDTLLTNQAMAGCLTLGFFSGVKFHDMVYISSPDILYISGKVFGSAMQRDPGQKKRLQNMKEMKAAIERSRLAGEDTLAADSMNKAERKSLRRSRPAKARPWNLLTDMEAKGLAYVPG
jgi:hypothetical protein